MSQKKIIVLLIVISSYVSACALCPPVDPQQKLIMQFDDYMIPLSKAVDVVADKLPPDAKDQEIFSEAIKRSGDTELTKPFVGYVLKARIDKENETAVILLCSPNGKEGIIEDVTCTTRPDMHRPSGSPCEYLLDVKRVCEYGLPSLPGSN
jgi:hypothetical protein